MKIDKCSFPCRSLIAKEAKNADFHDSYQLTSIQTDLSPLDIYISMVNETPAWINLLLSIRNKLVQSLGLKDVGKLGGIKRPRYDESLIGKKLDIFNIDLLVQDEIILTQKDKHLDLKISILKYKSSTRCSNPEANLKTNIVISSLVNYNNLVGRTYMFVILPFHKMIVKRMLRIIMDKQE